ncbi:MAG: hypothetical protein U0165_10685 [Polyangiaceae bacterium]
MRRLIGISAMVLGVTHIGMGCSGSDDTPSSTALTSDPTAENPAVGETRQMVPDAKLPQEYQDKNGPSNNNLDVVRHDGKVFLAIRNGKFHFASADTRLYVFSSSDEKTWSFETKIDLGTDVREPRFLSYNGKLFLYFAQLGTNEFDFEPKGMWFTQYNGPGSWAEPTKFYKPDEPYIPWRAKVLGGKPYLIVYKNGQNIYDFKCTPMQIELLTTEDGINWKGVNPENPVVSEGGGSETDFDFDDRGDLYAVIRNEGGEVVDGDSKFGSKICRAKKDNITKWECAYDRRKYDSPKVFAYQGQIFLIGRRNDTEDGYFDLYDDPSSPDPDCSFEATQNGIEYSKAKKRTSLWQVDRVNLTVRYMMDLPGWGDTCFPSTLVDETNPARLFVYNYSSPLDGPDLPWHDGQEGQTNIYRTEITMK